MLAPRTDDAHQDHRLVAEIAPTVWRDQLVLGYEIPKYDGDLGRPSLYVAARRGDRAGEGAPAREGVSVAESAGTGGTRRRSSGWHACVGWSAARYAEAFAVTKATLAW